jgi:hypothetical protein
MAMVAIGVGVAALAAGATMAMKNKADEDAAYQRTAAGMGLQIGVIADTISQNLNYAQQMDRQQEGARMELTELQRNALAGQAEYMAKLEGRGVSGGSVMQGMFENENDAMFAKGNIISDSEAEVEETAFTALIGLKDAQSRIQDAQRDINNTQASRKGLGMQIASVAVAAIGAGASAYSPGKSGAAKKPKGNASFIRR